LSIRLFVVPAVGQYASSVAVSRPCDYLASRCGD